MVYALLEVHDDDKGVDFVEEITISNIIYRQNGVNFTVMGWTVSEKFMLCRPITTTTLGFLMKWPIFPAITPGYARFPKVNQRRTFEDCYCEIFYRPEAFPVKALNESVKSNIMKMPASISVE